MRVCRVNQQKLIHCHELCVFIFSSSCENIALKWHIHQSHIGAVKVATAFMGFFKGSCVISPILARKKGK